MYIITISRVHDAIIDHKVCWSGEANNQLLVPVFHVRSNVHSEWSGYTGRFLPCINEDMGGARVTNSREANIKTR